MKPAEPCRILVIDDDPDSAAALAAMLDAEGCDTRTVLRPEAAVDEALAFGPDVIFLDLLFGPGSPLNGLDVAQALRAEALLTGTLLVALSGLSEDAQREACREAGFDAHFPKPFEPALVNELVTLASRGEGFDAASPLLYCYALEPQRGA